MAIKTLLILLVIMQVKGLKQTCELVFIKGLNYEKEILKKDVDSPYQFAIDYSTNTLFFSYSTHTKDQRFQLAYINLDTKQFNIISGIIDGFASAVDNVNKKIYLGGKEGIYDFNLKTKQIYYLTATSHNIWQMFFKDHLYYTTYPNEEAYIYKDGVLKRLTELSDTKTMLIGLDMNKNIYFSNSSGLFNYKKSSGKIYNLGEFVINGISADKTGKLYFSTPKAIFVINEEQNTVERLFTEDNIFSLAIEENGNIIYGGEDNIIRLKKSTKKCKD